MRGTRIRYLEIETSIHYENCKKVPLVILKVPLDILTVSSLASYMTQRNTANYCSQENDSKCVTQVDDTSVDVQACFFSLHPQTNP